MPYENDNTAVLYPNDKGNNPKRPDYRGSATFDGKEWKLSAWIREAKQGKRAGMKFLSIRAEAVEPKQRTQTPEPKPNPASSFDPNDQDVPF